MELVWYFLPMIIFLGIITSYEDVKFGKIRNRWVLLAIFYSFLVLFILILNLYFSNVAINYEYIKTYAINFAFSFFVGLFLSYSGLWSAGDAKLFMAFSALIPLTVYKLVYFQLFPSFVVLVNSFIPIFAFLFAKMFFRANLHEKVAALKTSMQKSLVESVISVLALSSLLAVITSLAGITTDILTNLIVLFLTYFVLKKIFGKRIIEAMTILLLVVLFYRYEYIFSLQFLPFFASMLFSFVFIEYFVLNLGFYGCTKPVYIENLEPGMALAETIYRDGKKYLKSSRIRYSILPESDDKIKSVFNYRLTKEDIIKLKKLHSEGKFKPHIIRTHENLPFAPILFSGTVLTLIFGGSLLSIII